MTFYDIDGASNGVETIRLEGIDSYAHDDDVNLDIDVGDNFESRNIAIHIYPSLEKI